MAFTEEQLYDMSDAELTTAFNEAKAELDSPDTELETINTEEVTEDQPSDEEYEDDLEQPEEDSDHNSEEDEVEDTDEEDSETEIEDNLEEGPEDLEEEATAEDENTEDDAQEVQKLAFRADGKDYEFTREEMDAQFPRIFGQAVDYTKKMQAIKPYRKTIDAMNEAGITHDDINLLISARSGDKGAVAEMLKRTGVDALDLDESEDTYVAKDYGRDESTIALNDIVDSIKSDPEYTITQNILGSQWDDASINEVTKNPEIVKLLHVDVQSGVYDKVSPIMNKLKVYDGARKSDLEYYKEASGVYIRELTSAEAAKNKAAKVDEEATKIATVKAQSAKRTATKEASKKRKAATPTRSRVSNNSVTDYLDAYDDDQYDAWVKEMDSK